MKTAKTRQSNIMRTANRDRKLAVSNFEHVQSLKRPAPKIRLDTSVNQLKNELKSPINVRVRFSDGIVKRQSVTGALVSPPPRWARHKSTVPVFWGPPG